MDYANVVLDALEEQHTDFVREEVREVDCIYFVEEEVPMEGCM